MSERARKLTGRLGDNPWMRAPVRVRVRWALVLTMWLALIGIGLRWLLVLVGVVGANLEVFGVVAAWALFVWGLALWPRTVTRGVRWLLRPRALVGLVIAVSVVTLIRTLIT